MHSLQPSSSVAGSARPPQEAEFFPNSRVQSLLVTVPLVQDQFQAPAVPKQVSVLWPSTPSHRHVVSFVPTTRLFSVPAAHGLAAVPHLPSTRVVLQAGVPASQLVWLEHAAQTPRSPGASP